MPECRALFKRLTGKGKRKILALSGYAKEAADLELDTMEER